MRRILAALVLAAATLTITAPPASADHTEIVDRGDHVCYWRSSTELLCIAPSGVSYPFYAPAGHRFRRTPSGKIILEPIPGPHPLHNHGPMPKTWA